MGLAFFFSIAHVTFPDFLRCLLAFRNAAPFAQSVREIGLHPALDFGQHVAHQAIGARRFAVTAVADRASPQMRRLLPSGSGFSPPRMPNQRRGTGEQRHRHIIDGAGRGFAGLHDPICPWTKHIERQCRR